jgi:hypothetical protein
MSLLRNGYADISEKREKLFIKSLYQLNSLRFFLKICQLKMRKTYFRILINLTVLFLFACVSIHAQESGAFRKNAVSINLTRTAVCEINIGYERFLTTRKSIEFDFGLIYKNTYLAEKAGNWTNNPLFTEQGFAFRVHYKFFKRKEDNSRWQDYIAPGLSYKHTYYEDREMETDVRYDSSVYKPPLTYTIQYLQKRDRDKFGLEFVWGKVYEASHVFAFEFYYGAALEATFSERTDYSRYVKYTKASNQSKNFYYPSYVDYSFYVHPVILLGFKIRMKI